MAKDRKIWECSSCGFTQSKWSGSCLNCSSWNSFFEKMQINEKTKRFEAKKTTSTCMKLKDIKISSFVNFFLVPFMSFNSLSLIAEKVSHFLKLKL